MLPAVTQEATALPGRRETSFIGKGKGDVYVHYSERICKVETVHMQKGVRSLKVLGIRTAGIKLWAACADGVGGAARDGR